MRTSSPACALVSPTVRDKVNDQMTSTRKLDVLQMSSVSYSEREAVGNTVPPPPPPPPFHSSALELTQQTTLSTLPSITISAVSLPPAEAVGSHTGNMEDNSRPLAMNVQGLRAALKLQKQRLKMTGGQLKSPIQQCEQEASLEGELLDVSSHSSLGNVSINSCVVRLAAQTASNRENFNYLAGHRYIILIL